MIIPGSQVEVVFGNGSLDNLGRIARSLGASRTLLVSDPGIREAGHVERAVRNLTQSGLTVWTFDRVVENPTTDTVDGCLQATREFRPDLIVGLGGGSSMDTAKGVNFLYTNGGRMADYWGAGKASKPMLPMIAIPTTAGTGSEAQSYALISDAKTHVKMACGDPKALPRVAILDPDLTATQPPRVAAMTGIDAIAHAVETAACTRRNPTSRGFSRRAWEILAAGYERAVRDPQDGMARRAMLLGAHLAGCAIENSMLGAAHATANPLTAKFDVPHGMAVGLMLPHVVRFNVAEGANAYSDLAPDADELTQRIETLLDAASLPRQLRDLKIAQESLPELTHLASQQWTAAFNPRPVGEAELLAIYNAAF